MVEFSNSKMATSKSAIVMSPALGVSAGDATMVVLGELSFEHLYDYLLNLTCSNELKFWMACNAACSFRCVELTNLYNLFSDFLGDGANHQVEISETTKSSLIKVMFSSLSPEEMSSLEWHSSKFRRKLQQL